MAKNLNLPDFETVKRDKIATFPKEFGLRAFPADRFRINAQASYFNHIGEPGSDDYELVLVIDRLVAGQWLNFSKGTVREVREQLDGRVHINLTKAEAEETLRQLRSGLGQVVVRVPADDLSESLDALRRAITRYELLLQRGHIQTSFGTMTILE